MCGCKGGNRRARGGERGIDTKSGTLRKYQDKNERMPLSNFRLFHVFVHVVIHTPKAGCVRVKTLLSEDTSA